MTSAQRAALDRAITRLYVRDVDQALSSLEWLRDQADSEAEANRPITADERLAIRGRAIEADVQRRRSHRAQ